MTTPPAGYVATAEMTLELVQRAAVFGAERPLFAFPAGSVALLASLADVGEQLARNDSARSLVRELLAETKRRRLGDYPTTIMLRVSLDLAGVPILEASLKDLGIEIVGVPGRGGTS